jgi:hypothetical protein
MQALFERHTLGWTSDQQLFDALADRSLSGIRQDMAGMVQKNWAKEWVPHTGEHGRREVRYQLTPEGRQALGDNTQGGLGTLPKTEDS